MIVDEDLKDGEYGIYKDLKNGWFERIEKKSIYSNQEYFYQYVVSYKRNGKWYRDSEKYENSKLAIKRLNELKQKRKYEDYKIMFREISKWFDFEILGDKENDKD